MSIKVLYVDDEDVPRYIFEKIFEPKYSIIIARSGQEALDKMSRLNGEFIVIISDMRMPQMNGVEFITKAQAKYQNIACFILTSLVRDDDIDLAIKDNLIKKVFKKPLNVEEIETAIQEVLT